jgi:hypothetical protein
VHADDVRPALRALAAANKAWEADDWSAAHQAARHQAFADLQSAVFGIARREVTVKHIEQVALAAYKDGLLHGEEALRRGFRKMLGL